MEEKFLILINAVILTFVISLIPFPPDKEEVMRRESEETNITPPPDTIVVRGGEKKTVVDPPKEKKKVSLRVTTTYYNPVPSQTDDTPGITADNSIIPMEALRKGTIRWIAISQDLLSEYPLGSKVLVTSGKYPEINGVYEIHDVMNRRHRYRIDILMHPSKGCPFSPHITEIRKIHA